MATQTSGTDANPYSWVGKLGYRLDCETSLYLLGGGGDGRYYDPATAKFLSKDPAESDGNTYRSASNDPVNGLDPSGMQPPFDEDNPLGVKLNNDRIFVKWHSTGSNTVLVLFKGNNNVKAFDGKNLPWWPKPQLAPATEQKDHNAIAKENPGIALFLPLDPPERAAEAVAGR